MKKKVGLIIFELFASVSMFVVGVGDIVPGISDGMRRAADYIPFAVVEQLDKLL